MGNAPKSKRWRSSLSCQTRSWRGTSYLKRWHITAQFSEENGLKAEPTTDEPTSQLNKQRGVNLEMVYRSLLRIASHLDISQSSGDVAHEAEKQYTQGMLRQTTERELDDLANPASGISTTQG